MLLMHTTPKCAKFYTKEEH
uniref:Uncharacterized protein n=1 Tax=Rhizophora mucronata TaxID=61149 RepID=A0A2P2NR15_RHIMU